MKKIVNNINYYRQLEKSLLLGIKSLINNNLEKQIEFEIKLDLSYEKINKFYIYFKINLKNISYLKMSKNFNELNNMFSEWNFIFETELKDNKLLIKIPSKFKNKYYKLFKKDYMIVNDKMN